ncbi:MAG: hypothetical protein RLY31_1633 [Bacteroidota bacterium]
MTNDPYQGIPTPAFVLEEDRFRSNLELLSSVQSAAGVSIILALKGFAMWRMFPMVRRYLSGATASSLHEARLIYEEMGCPAHTYAVAYRRDELAEILRYSSHLVFNSLAQYERFRPVLASAGHPVSCGIRVNPEYSPVGTALYNPAAPGSRLGEVADSFPDGLPAGLEGLHFHTLCESTSHDLERTLEALERGFGRLLRQVRWVNMGGGHLMTRAGYDTEHLVGLLKAFREKWDVSVILEPGSAVAWETGPLLSTVLDIHESRGVRTAIMDISFTCHMPDTLEMPYRPRIRGVSDTAREGWHPYRIGGVSCLSGDFMAEYWFREPPKVGDRLVFEDMMHYTMVKTTTFNGVRHPDIVLLREDGTTETVRRFGYEDYRDRLS